MEDNRLRIGLFGLLIVIVTAGGGLLLLGGNNDDVKSADDLDWLCDRVAVESVEEAEPAADPEAAVTQVVPDAQLVEAYSSDDEVLLAWVDDDGEALQSHHVVKVDGGWVVDEVQSCEDD